MAIPHRATQSEASIRDHIESMRNTVYTSRRTIADAQQVIARANDVLARQLAPTTAAMGGQVGPPRS